MFEPYPWLPLLRPIDVEMTIRLALAFALGAVIGLERETHRRPAGLRTHMLVAGGSAAFTLVSIYGFVGQGTVLDPGRVAAQIVVGIGFLGAGTILRTSGNVRWLTTAASVWIVAAVGMLAGTGMYLLAIVTTIGAFATLRWDPPMEKRSENPDGEPSAEADTSDQERPD